WSSGPLNEADDADDADDTGALSRLTHRARLQPAHPPTVPYSNLDWRRPDHGRNRGAVRKPVFRSLRVCSTGAVRSRIASPGADHPNPASELSATPPLDERSFRPIDPAHPST